MVVVRWSYRWRTWYRNSGMMGTEDKKDLWHTFYYKTDNTDPQLWGACCPGGGRWPRWPAPASWTPGPSGSRRRWRCGRRTPPPWSPSSAALSLRKALLGDKGSRANFVKMLPLYFKTNLAPFVVKWNQIRLEVLMGEFYDYFNGNKSFRSMYSHHTRHRRGIELDTRLQWEYA